MVLITDTLPDYTCEYFLGLNIRTSDSSCKSGSIGNDFFALLVIGSCEKVTYLIIPRLANFVAAPRTTLTGDTFWTCREPILTPREPPRITVQVWMWTTSVGGHLQSSTTPKKTLGRGEDAKRSNITMHCTRVTIFIHSPFVDEASRTVFCPKATLYTQ